MSKGIIRRIDDLGRIVVPKEIRKNLDIVNGDLVEIKNVDDSIIILKYSTFSKYEADIRKIIEIVKLVNNVDVIVTNKSKVFMASDKIDVAYKNELLSEYLLNVIAFNKTILETNLVDINFIHNQSIECSYVIVPIIVEEYVNGLVIIFSKSNKITDLEKNVALIVSNLIANIN